ncbi:hypothetical protein KSS87_008024, partial [Heliosperma pusillum]
YLALEYFQHGKVSYKTDVYAFGVAKPLFDKGDIDGSAVAACVNTDEACQPSMNEAIPLLRGEACSVKGKASFSRNGSYSQILRRTKSDMKDHLAMLDVSELEDDDFLYSR